MEEIDYPVRLYKYRSLADMTLLGYVKDSLLNSRFYWPTPSQFNDPFDCSPVALFPSERAKRESYAKRLVRQNMPLVSRAERRATYRRMTVNNLAEAEAKLPEIFRDRMARVGVYSLAEEPHNVLMWSHYADSHRGICFRLTPTRFDQDFFPAFQVLYSEERPVVDMIDDSLLDWSRKALLTKAQCWRYEREWRVFDVQQSGFHAFRPGLLDAVILGALISEENRARVSAWVKARTPPTKLIQARFDDKKFRVIIEET